jgi:hypothetical protein
MLPLEEIGQNIQGMFLYNVLKITREPVFILTRILIKRTFHVTFEQSCLC